MYIKEKEMGPIHKKRHELKHKYEQNLRFRQRFDICIKYTQIGYSQNDIIGYMYKNTSQQNWIYTKRNIQLNYYIKISISHK